MTSDQITKVGVLLSDSVPYKPGDPIMLYEGDTPYRTWLLSFANDGVHAMAGSLVRSGITVSLTGEMSDKVFMVEMIFPQDELKGK